ncbi:uridine kinase family protein [Cellulomonas dongxiuzhuiae]|uniref:uridine kinase family protein n=1 Tax=Cellulomonas dongxiuzhuiae TaxID=2819979 RepID=UPI0027DBEBD6|nr:uridine kinase [Cellulomonas dongxiuzhuiae]
MSQVEVARDGSAGAPVVVDRALRSAPRLGRVRLVCIDGPAGSGKTTTAADVARELLVRDVAVAVVHLDDLYDGWRGLEGSLWPRLSAQVLEPLRRGGPGRFQRYDWATGAFAEWVDVPVRPVLVLEGCGSARRSADAVASVRVWVEAPDDVRLARGLARDGQAAEKDWTAWMADERAHFARERTRERADIRLDGTGRVTGRRPDADGPTRDRSGLA